METFLDEPWRRVPHVLDNNHYAQQFPVCSQGGHYPNGAHFGINSWERRRRGDVMVVPVLLKLVSGDDLLTSLRQFKRGHGSVENQLWLDGIWRAGLQNSTQHSCQCDKIKDIGVGLWGGGWS